jgi:hypothetical protein
VAAGRQKEARLAVDVNDGERHEGRAKVEGEASPNKRMHRSAAGAFLVNQPMRHAAPGDAGCWAPCPRLLESAVELAR